ncbi:MAG: hypothetical protein RL026_535 [Pseudomonadota bacterium]|jgi:leader peptidase (prepilin peptidase)/N-methyltransferase
MAVAELLAGWPAAFIATCLLLGLLVGSFLNVVIHRVPVMLEQRWRRECAEFTGGGPAAGADTPTDAAPYNLVVPGSACPQCKAPIRPWHNLPLLGFVLLRGRCADCHAPIGLRYPLVELITGVAFAAVAWRFGWGAEAVLGLALTAFLIALAGIDFDTQLLPDALTLPLLWLGLGASLVLPAATGGRVVPVPLPDAVLGAMVGYLSLWSVFHLFRLLTGKEGMGHGDFKLLAALGAWLGWQLLLPLVLVAAAAGAVTGGVLIALRRQGRDVPIPFGPFLAAAGWLMLLAGHGLVDRYLALFAAG